MINESNSTSLSNSFTQIQNLTIKEIYELYFKFIESLPDDDELEKNINIICPHNVYFNSGIWNKEQDCEECKGYKEQHDRFSQQSGILYFLLCDNQNKNYFINSLSEKFNFFQKKGVKSFLDINQLKAICNIFTKNEYKEQEQKYNLVCEELKKLNEKCLPEQIVYDLNSKYVVVMIEKSKGYFINYQVEQIKINSLQKLLNTLASIETKLSPFRFPNPCIHTIFVCQKSPSTSFWNLTINMYNKKEQCSCGENTYAKILCHREKSDENLKNHFDKYKESQKIEDILKAIDIFNQQPRHILQSERISQAKINFKALSIYQKLKTQDQDLEETYKQLFLQEIIELLESQIYILQYQKSNQISRYEELLNYYQNIQFPIQSIESNQQVLQSENKLLMFRIKVWQNDLLNSENENKYIINKYKTSILKEQNNLDRKKLILSFEKWLKDGNDTDNIKLD